MFDREWAENQGISMFTGLTSKFAIIREIKVPGNSTTMSDIKEKHRENSVPSRDKALLETVEIKGT